MRRQKWRTSREGSHRGKAPSRVKDQRDHSRLDPQSQVKPHLDRHQGKVRVHPVRDRNQVLQGKYHLVRGRNLGKVLLAQDQGKVRGQNQIKDPLVRPPGKVKGSRHLDQIRVKLSSKKVAHHNKDLENLDQTLKGSKAPCQKKVQGPLGSRQLESLQVDSVLCVKPPSSTLDLRSHPITTPALSARTRSAACVASAHQTQR